MYPFMVHLFKLKFKDLLTILHVAVCVHGCESTTDVHEPIGARGGIESLGIGVTCSCKLPYMWVLGTEPGSSVRALRFLNR